MVDGGGWWGGWCHHVLAGPKAIFPRAAQTLKDF